MAGNAASSCRVRKREPVSAWREIEVTGQVAVVILLRVFVNDIVAKTIPRNVGACLFGMVEFILETSYPSETNDSSSDLYFDELLV